MSVVIQPATIDTVAGIDAIVGAHANRGQVLPRSVADIRDNIDDWVVAVDGETVLACGSLVSYSSMLSEVRSLVVADRVKRKGLGTAVLETLIAKARRRDISTLFALTRVVPFFERAGFHITDKADFPEKIWRDCRLCLIEDRCDEVAVILSLDGPAGETVSS